MSLIAALNPKLGCAAEVVIVNQTEVKLELVTDAGKELQNTIQDEKRKKI